MLELHLICPYCGKDYPRFDNDVIDDEGAGRICPRCGSQMPEWDYTDVKHAFLTLCDLDEKLNCDKEGVPLPSEKQGWKIEIRQG